MWIIMKQGASEAEIRQLMARLESQGLGARRLDGSERTAIEVPSAPPGLSAEEWEMLPGVAQAVMVSSPIRLSARLPGMPRSVIRVGDVPVGGRSFTVIAGPCAVESETQLLGAARAVRAAGAHILRGGAFKPRSSPYSFQGLGEEGLRLLVRAREETGLPFVTEALDPDGVRLVAQYADAVQIGARNMQNTALLRAAGRGRLPVFLKRGMAARLEELLLAAEYILAEGNDQVFLCERGVRTFADHSRNTLDLNAVPAVQERSRLPILVDASHGTGRRSQVAPLSLAALAAGADGLMLEVHPDPESARSDGPQALRPQEFAALMERLRALAPLLDRRLEIGGACGSASPADAAAARSGGRQVRRRAAAPAAQARR